ncbi:MAG: HEAT repeat domain-containing protein [Planctomycetota bacterium]|nr:HEAT repeat domain-containing protein [Planctomycetota bacterium]
MPVRALLALFLLLAAPVASVASAADDLTIWKSELETRLDDADESLFGKVADLGSREAMQTLVDLYPKLRSVFMQREIVRVLHRFDGKDDAEQPALQHLMDVAVGAQARELRLAALDGLGRSKRHGRTFLRMIVEAPALDEVREMAMELHVAGATDADNDWYREVFSPKPAAAPEGGNKNNRRRNKQDEPDAEPERTVPGLESLRELAFGPLAGAMEDRELLEVFGQDRNLNIKVAAMDALASRDFKGLEPLASELLDNISLPARMRAQAAEILIKERGASVADRFIELAKKQEVTQDYLRMRMAELLADLRDPKVDKTTEKLIGKGKPHQRAFALVASKHNQESKVVKKLIGALKDKDERVWRAAVDIAAQRRFEDAVDDLEKLLSKYKQDEERLVPLLVALTSIQGPDQEWQATLEEYAVGEARDVRNAALRALAQYGGERYIPMLTDALQHADWSTRYAALRGLEKVHTPAVLAPIVARMGQEEGRLVIEFADVLWRLTGKPYRTRAGAWADWYAQEGAGFALIDPRELERVKLEEENRRLRQVTKATEFFGIRIESTRVIFIIDVSGSMNEPLRGQYVGRDGEVRMSIAKRELKDALEGLDATALYNIVTFSSGVDTWIDGVVGASEKSREDATEFVERLGAGGGTNLYEAIQTAFKDADVDTIIILSDGEPTVGPVTQPALIREDVARWNEHRGIKIHCVSVGGSLRVLEWLAADHGGTYIKYQ